MRQTLIASLKDLTCPVIDVTRIGEVFKSLFQKLYPLKRQINLSLLCPKTATSGVKKNEKKTRLKTRLKK